VVVDEVIHNRLVEPGQCGPHARSDLMALPSSCAMVGSPARQKPLNVNNDAQCRSAMFRPVPRPMGLASSPNVNVRWSPLRRIDQ
jgi:hypothetical protein